MLSLLEYAEVNRESSFLVKATTSHWDVVMTVSEGLSTSGFSDEMDNARLCILLTQSCRLRFLT